MISIERKLMYSYLLIESKKEAFTFDYKDEVNLTFFKVDGGHVRNNDEIDFSGGGHHLVYKCVPENEVWLEETFPDDELAFFSMHEIFEYLLMKYEKKSYDRAHDIANHYEGLLRHDAENYEDIIKSYVEDDFKDKEDLEPVLCEFWLKIK